MKSGTNLKRIVELKIGVAALSLFAVGVLSCAALGAQRPGTARTKDVRFLVRQPTTDAQKFIFCLRPCVRDDSACYVACLALSGETDESVLYSTGSMPQAPAMHRLTSVSLNDAISNVQSCAEAFLVEPIRHRAFWVCAGAASRLFLKNSRIENFSDPSEGPALRFGLGVILRLANIAVTDDGFDEGVRSARQAVSATVDPSGGVAAITPIGGGSTECFNQCVSDLQANLSTCGQISNQAAQDACEAAAIAGFNICAETCFVPAE